MGDEYVADLNHIATLRELVKKLPMFLRAKWTECAGKIIELGRRPKFQDFVKFIKERAKMVDNEFGQDMNSVTSKVTTLRRGKPDHSGTPQGLTVFATGTAGCGRQHGGITIQATCLVCSGQHEIWKCKRFRGLTYEEKRKIVREGGLCNKCLAKGHIAKECPKRSFKCQISGCGGDHHSLMHRLVARACREFNGGTTTETSNSNTGSVIVKTEQQSHLIQAPTSSGDSTGAGDRNELAVAATGAGETRVCLGIIPVKVKGEGGDRTIETYALLDNGSEVTLCHERLAKTLELDGETLKFTLTGMTGSERVESKLVNIIVKSIDGSFEVQLPNVKTVASMPISPNCIATKEDLSRWPHLQDVDLPALKGGEVFLLIGLKERPTLFLPLELKVGGDEEPIAVRYSLGWTVMGPLSEQKKDHSCSVHFLHATNDRTIQGPHDEDVFMEKVLSVEDDSMDESNGKEKDNNPEELMSEELIGTCCANLPQLKEDETEYENDSETLCYQLERLWKTDFGDSVVGTKPVPSVEDNKALAKMNASLQRVNGHFQVALPWREDSPCLPNNKAMADQRLELLKKRLRKDEGLHQKYCTAMQDYITKGHAQRVPEEELQSSERPVWYLPHHPVTHPLKPGKVRVVFDCRAKFHRTSLNQQLLQGPDLTNPLTGVLIRFRQEPVAIAADIEAMFLQVYVQPEDCDALRFLWWPGGNLNEDPQEYRMVKHLFGATSSPSVANFCLKKTASIYQLEFDPDVVRTVERNMYVDDLMKSVDTTETAVRMSTQLRDLLAKGGFRLTKWMSNDRKVLAEIPETERATSVVDLGIEELPTEGALGLKWNVEADEFVWKASVKLQKLVKERSATRRGILSVVSSLFDPLGFMAPYVMKAKLLLQQLCRKKLGWDSAIEEPDRVQWLRWLDDLPKLQDVHVDRCFKPKDFGEIKSIQLHMFSDGSRVGYGAVAYLRLVDVYERIHCSFDMGKARLAPIHEITIPRLELTAAVISVNLKQIISEELELKVDRLIYWTDSTTVLKCLNNDSKRFHTFESNRLSTIRSCSSPSDWRYVPRDINPADDASKGLRLDELVERSSRWLNGPTFLWKEEQFWPEMLIIPPLKDSDPEVRKESRIYITATALDPLDRLMEHYSSWWKLKRAFVGCCVTSSFCKERFARRNWRHVLTMSPL